MSLLRFVRSLGIPSKDPFHTYASLASLALLDRLRIEEEEETTLEQGPILRLGLKEMDPIRNVGRQAGGWLDDERKRLGW